MENSYTEDELLKYINDYIAILNKNFAKNTKKRIPYSDIFEIMKDLYGLFNEYAKLNPKKCGEIVIKQYIPLLNMIISIDSDSTHFVEYDKEIENAYRLASYVSLEHYMIYREWHEKDEDKFYQPRMEIMRGYIHYLQEIALNPNFRLLIANMPSGYGKLIANFVPVLTKDGWKKHGDLKVGDYVLSPNGNFIKVYHVFPKRFANVKITFEDGEEIYCHNQHEWQVYDRNKQCERHIEVNDMINCFKEKDGRNRFYIPNHNMVIGEEKELPVDPYTYGVWLGDGTTKQGIITENINDLNIFNYIPYQISNIQKGASDKVNSYHLKGLANDLHKLNLCYENHKEEKYINDIYLTSSINQRLELLAGIIDTDGYLDKVKNRYIITTANETLKNDIVSLISTFNWRVSVTKVNKCISSSGIVGKKDVYYIGFNHTIEIPCKIDRKKSSILHKQKRIGISNIEFTDLTEGNCISVEGGLYLVGRTLKMTHNTYPEKISEAWNFGVDSTGTVLSLCSNDDVVKGGSRTVIDELKSETFGNVFPKMKYDKEDKSYFLKETDSNWKLRNCKMLASYYASTLNSIVVGERASQRIHIDDLYADYKEAQNAELNKYYLNKYNTVWKKRFVQNRPAKVVVTGTLWASGDFIALLIAQEKKEHKFHKDTNYKYTYVSEDGSVAIVQVPALDYETGLSTCPELRTTEEVLKDKNNMDEYLFQTNFQQKPVDPESLYFSYNNLRTYQQLPETDFQGTYAVIDATRKTGRDYFSMPIFMKKKNDDTFDYYLKDCIFTQKATKDMYQEICDKIVQHHIIELVIESNVTSELMQNINEILKANNIFYCVIREKYNSENKEARITDAKGEIIRRLIFPAREKHSVNSDIGKFMENFTLYNFGGRNQHDDSPDSLALFTHEIVDGGSLPPKVIVFKRPF